MGYALTVQLPDEETFRSLERTAEILGMSMSELGEAALQIAALSTDLEGRLMRMSKGLEGHDDTGIERDIQDFAQSEVTYEDPLQARRIEMQDPYGIGALFGRRLE